MSTLLFFAERHGERFEIVDDGGGVGFLVLRYLEGLNTHDYLQDDLSLARECAEEEWGLSPSAWQVAQPGELPLWERGK